MGLRYLRWRLRHPRGTYGEFYNDVIAERLERGIPHRTLGTKVWTNENGKRRVPGFATLAFSERGLGLVGELVSFGLTRASTCVDFGCGSLRIGQHLMRILPAGHYWGLDVTDRFYKEALGVLPPELVSSSRPHLHVIGEAVLAELERRPPDFVFSYAVLKHVPARELDRYFNAVMRLIGPATIAVIYFTDAPARTRIGPMSWAYPAELLIAKVLARCPQAQLGLIRLGTATATFGRHPRSVLWIGGAKVNARIPTGAAAGAPLADAAGALL